MRGAGAEEALAVLQAEGAAELVARRFVGQPPQISWKIGGPNGLTWEENERHRRIADRLAVGVAAEEAIRKITGEPNK